MIQGIVSFEDWMKLDLRVGKILEAADIEGADKLYRMTIDIGDETRTICSGIKEQYTKEELKDKPCIVFTNLTPKKLRGIESHGMILAAVNKDESEVILITPEKDAPVGWKVC